MLEPESFVLENAVLVLPDRLVDKGWVTVADGRIVEWGEGDAPERGFDLKGDYLLPGLIELHTDHLESHFAPRPHVRWHALSAVTAYDAQIAASGITTVFDSLRAGSDADSASIGADLVTLAEALDAARRIGGLRVDHRTHLRCEIASPDVVEQVESYVARFPVHLMSLMDHTPGQRQFRDLETWRRFYTRRTSMSESEIQQFIQKRLDLHERFAADHRKQLVAVAEKAGAVLASHDDATADHVAESVADGVHVAEFPTTVEAAEASHGAGVAVMMGAPNVVRGGSHSGNVAAETLGEAGLLDVLSSDYVPASLLFAAFHLPRRVASITLPQAITMVTSAPAKATGLDDRGEIAVGKRADLVRVAVADEAPMVRRVWTEGRFAA
ncbi:alpha-D-ribose 1-methylphosphonate 5-triphosphate diphosphatase [Mesorhizobium sp. RP14(2022)]|uniref:Alpha-D-ribose 1-methylphosphonate 5-triphosphate diphosphatase n=1 Tax=Mesorhizobium liriopis TaxID=2953882 RepID=A0ABT1C074_9HYPH|nr:alpha-D-ribose 1-methylphosphonate 5-triphosphate diphosphatase [Mesorhizobium liriopis]MCO6048236.1 alpha-D-ribose 1-methylphosphonate 5-triphosphate diphosphatase [Mesorhizobium liriopis]